MRVHVISEDAKGAGAFWRASEWLAEGLRRHPRVQVVHGDTLKGYPLRGADNEEGDFSGPATCTAVAAAADVAGTRGAKEVDETVDWYIYLWMSTRPKHYHDGESINITTYKDQEEAFWMNTRPWLGPEIASVDRSKLVVIDLQVCKSHQYLF